MLWKTHATHWLLTTLFGLILLLLFSNLDYARSKRISDQVFTQIHHRALQDFYELANEVKQQLNAEYLSLPSNIEPFAVLNSDENEWQFNIDLNQMRLRVVPATSGTQSGHVQFIFSDQQHHQQIVFDMQGWIEALCADAGYDDLPFSLLYRDQPVFSSGDLNNGDMYRQDEFIFPELSLLLDRRPLTHVLSVGDYVNFTVIIMSLMFWWILRTHARHKYTVDKMMTKLQESYHEKQEINAILSQQVQATAHSQKELLKRHYELQDLNHSLEMAQHQAQFSERLASLGEISAGIVHEINNPVAYIGSNLRELENDVASLRAFIATLDQASDYLDVHSEFYQALLASFQQLNIQEALEDAPLRLEDCIKGVERVRKIIQDMKRLSCRGDADKTWCDINDDIKSVINISTSQMKGNINLKSYLIELPNLYCNASQISQVLTNIIVNAIQALGDKNGTITLTEKIQGDHVVLEVCDDGPGMDRATAKRVFEPFFTTKEAGQGTGMGLSLCYKLIAEHSGWIDLKTAPGNGSCFSVYLPLDITEKEVKC